MTNRIRVLIRRRGEQNYLQPSGEWLLDRESAQEFTSSSFAFWWAQEQNFRDIEILWASDDSYDDQVAMSIRNGTPSPGLHRTRWEFEEAA